MINTRSRVIPSLHPHLHLPNPLGCLLDESVPSIASADLDRNPELAGEECRPCVVMDVLGHSQLSITMDLYFHVMPSALRDAANAMDRPLGGRR
jgi:integrase